MSKDKKKMGNRKYTKEFKESSVQLVLNSEELTNKEKCERKRTYHKSYKLFKQ